MNQAVGGIAPMINQRSKRGQAMKADVVTVRCKACQTPLQVPAGGKRLCACGTWVAAPPPAPVATAADDEPVLVAKPEQTRIPTATAVPPPIPTAAPAAGAPVATSWPRLEGDLSAIA